MSIASIRQSASFLLGVFPRTLLLLAIAGGAYGCDLDATVSNPIGHEGGEEGEEEGDKVRPDDGDDVDTSCFAPPDSPDAVAAAIQHTLVYIDGNPVDHVRLILDPNFVDNTYGINSLGWDDAKGGEHKFDQLVGSDHAQLQLTDSSGALVLDFKMDYLSKDDASTSGFRNLGVLEGDGKVEVGDETWIVDTDTSMNRNFNEYGLMIFTEDSPATDANYTPSPDAPEWEYRVIYEAWIANEAFGTAGFGDASIEFIHASPSKTGNNTVEVEPTPCPPEWTCTDECCDEPYGCGGGGDGGNGGDGGGECTLDGDCVDGEFCAQGTCVPDFVAD
jgi:hypothetical protein